MRRYTYTAHVAFDIDESDEQALSSMMQDVTLNGVLDAAFETALDAWDLEGEFLGVAVDDAPEVEE